MTSRHSHQNAFAVLVTAIAMSVPAASAGAAGEPAEKSSEKVHPVAETKKAAKAVGHGVRKTAKVVVSEMERAQSGMGRET